MLRLFELYYSISMFTGIVSGIGVITAREELNGIISFSIEMPVGFLDGIAHGASVSVAGVCLTVVGVAGGAAQFDVMGETQAKTTLGFLDVGARVNVERSLTHGAEIGGHVVSGHVDGMAEVVEVVRSEGNVVATFQVARAIMKYIFTKGFIALDGASLTIVNARVAEGLFDVWFIPETLRATTFGDVAVGKRVNIEVDGGTRIIVDTLERSRIN